MFLIWTVIGLCLFQIPLRDDEPPPCRQANSWSRQSVKVDLHGDKQPPPPPSPCGPPPHPPTPPGIILSCHRICWPGNRQRRGCCVQLCGVKPGTGQNRFQKKPDTCMAVC